MSPRSLFTAAEGSGFTTEELRSRDNPVTLNPISYCSNMAKCEKILVYSVLLEMATMTTTTVRKE